MTLCSRCRAFNIQAFARHQFEYRGYPLGAFIRAAKDGCSFCGMLLEHLMAIDDGDKQKHLSIALGSEPGESVSLKWFTPDQLRFFGRWLEALIRPVWVNFYVTRGTDFSNQRADALHIIELNAFISTSVGSNTGLDGNTRTVKLHVAADPGTPAYASGDITGKLATEKYTWSWTHLNAIQSWHKECRETHPECAMTLSRSQTVDVEDAPLPSRCIEFFNDTQPNKDIPTCKWILRDTANQTGKYIALSHRWGPDTEAAKTTRENIECRMGRCTSCCDCSPSGLSLLFQEAGTLAVCLGVKYIWIDSVCIVQDDPQDWKRESVKMAQYYQYAWLTISATTLSSHGGLFGPLADDAIPRITRLPYMDLEGEQRGHLYVQCVGETMLARNYRKHISQSSLLRRGWVYQEWMLSRRILAFSGVGLFIQCERAAPRALIGDAVRDDSYDADELVGPIDLAFKESLKLDLSTRSAIFSSWLKVIETYSGLELTKLNEDRLIALAGVAKEFGLALQTKEKEESESEERGGNIYRYISGNWFGHTTCLLWEQVLSRDKPRVRVKGIPTWAWASMASQIVNDKGDNILTGMAVQWSSASNEVVCKMEKALNINVDTGTLQPLYHQPSTTPPENEFNKDNRFTMLGLKGRVFPARIHGYFEQEDDITAAAELTDYKSDFGRHMWRRVTTGSQSEFITGWASIEHPDYQEDETLKQDNGLCVLFVSTTAKVSGGWGLGIGRAIKQRSKCCFLGRRPCLDMMIALSGWVWGGCLVTTWRRISGQQPSGLYG